jgi:putative hydrolase of HD superfamily
MDKISELFFELGHLRRIKHEGWKLLGVKCPESVAEHSLRAAQIGYILAHLENYNKPEEICAMLVFHDMGESRIGDIHKVANRYIKANEEQAVTDQLKSLDKLGSKILDLWQNFEYKKTKAGIIARDADLLDMILTAKEYFHQGFSDAEDWIEKLGNKLETGSAKKILTHIEQKNPFEWWIGLKKM